MKNNLIKMFVSISKMTWLSKLRDTADKWKRTLQNTVFRNQQRLSSGSVSTAAS
jgi:hypothetical protein